MVRKMRKKAISLFTVTICILTIFLGLSATGIRTSLKENSSQNVNFIETSSDDWSMWRQNLEHTGFSECDGPDYEHILWRFKTDEKVDAIRSTASAANGKIYFGAMGGWDDEIGYFYCIDAENGKTIWKYETDDWIIDSAPAIYLGRVYVCACFNGLYCFDAETGKVLWLYEIDSLIEISPVVSDGKVFFGDDGKFFCLNAITGDEIWSSSEIGVTFSSPTVVNNKIYFGGNYFENHLNDDFICLDATNGNLIWNTTICDLENESAYIESTAAFFDNKVYFSAVIHSYLRGYYGKICCLNAENGEIIWFDNIDYATCSPSVAYGRVYVGDFDDSYKFYCYDANTGQLLWDYYIGMLVRGSPAIADGKVYVAARNLYCLDAFSGTLLWKLDTVEGGSEDGWFEFTSPIIAYDKIYVGSENSHLYCFGEISPSSPPKKPTITGEESGFVQTTYTYNIVSTDLDGDPVSYIVEWGNGEETGLLGPYESGEAINIDHVWLEKGTYVIKVKARDINGVESDWSTFPVTMPRNKVFNIFLFKILGQFPILQMLSNL